MIAHLLAEYGAALLAFIGIMLFVILVLALGETDWNGPRDGK